MTLTYDNGAGLVFSRQIAIDDKYMVTVTDSVTNKGSATLALSPYGRITRVGEPPTSGYYILHEGLVGVIGDKGLQEYKYKDIKKDHEVTWHDVTGGWLGITDKYWAATLIPDQAQPYTAHYIGSGGDTNPVYQTDFTAAAGPWRRARRSPTTSRLFAGAKQVSVLSAYRDKLGIEKFDLLIDWGWFFFITKPMFLVIDWLYRVFGNFGIAILLVTVVVKAVFFPLANKSYKSMSQMKKLQPQMTALREQYKDDKVKQQEELMKLYQHREDQPARRLLADGDPDSGVLLALQGAVRHHRDAPRAVLRLDPRPFGARPDPHLQPVRTAALRPIDGADDRPLPGDRHLAGDHGHHHVRPDEAEPDAARPHPGDAVHLDAGASSPSCWPRSRPAW